jgi:hydrogenase-1 operon protein HyaF
MKDFPIPVVTVGPGAQETADDEFRYLELPREMSTFQMPGLPDPESARGATEARGVLRWLAATTAAWPEVGGPATFDVGSLDAANRAVLDQVLGEGEVSVIVSGERDLRIQESVFAGVWRLRVVGPGNSVERDLVEVGPIPQSVLAAARERAEPQVPTLPVPEDAFSAPPILAEVADRAGSRRAGEPAHVINLSLLPLSPADGRHLGEVLAAGPVRILSRGYGSCRITSTIVRDTWWVQYVNGYGKPMVESIEITDVPEVAIASREDIADSASRVAEALEWLEQN